MLHIKVHIGIQTLSIYDDNNLIKEYRVSTAKNGVGEELGSEKTPRGLHLIRAKIGQGVSANTVFIKRRPTGEIYAPELQARFPGRDWILTRILWLSGQEIGKNRLGKVDTMRRYIYIHGTPDDVPMGIPGSRGCIRMRNHEVIELFNFIPIKTPLLIIA